MGGHYFVGPGGVVGCRNEISRVGPLQTIRSPGCQPPEGHLPRFYLCLRGSQASLPLHWGHGGWEASRPPLFALSASLSQGPGVEAAARVRFVTIWFCFPPSAERAFLTGYRVDPWQAVWGEGRGGCVPALLPILCPTVCKSQQLSEPQSFCL